MLCCVRFYVDCRIAVFETDSLGFYKHGPAYHEIRSKSPDDLASKANREWQLALHRKPGLRECERKSLHID